MDGYRGLPDLFPAGATNDDAFALVNSVMEMVKFYDILSHKHAGH